MARLGPVRDVPRVTSGSPVVMVLRPAQAHRRLNTVSASLALAKRGLSLLQAKRAIEEMIDKGSVAIELPMVEDRSVFRDEMAAAGVDARPGEEGN